ncbi:MAG TPA: diguanylate cyclase, partial [Thermoanaerobaculia bacterium]|nr:diguanylate cyclase [Thermoanaerobaculia bacterium]
MSVHFAGQRTLRNSVAEELRVGSRVLDRILDTRATQLAQQLSAVVGDFAFRGAVASADVATVTSVLANHGMRVGADAVMLVSLDGVVVADTLQGRMIERRFPYDSMLRAAEDRGDASAMVSFHDRPYQFVIVPVLAPRRIAWVCAGFEIDERVLADVRQLASIDVSLWSSTARSTPRLISTLQPRKREDLLARLSGVDRRRSLETTLQLGGTPYATLLEPLRTDDGTHINALLQRDLDEARRPFVTLELQIFMLSFVILLIAVIAAVTFARTVSRPLRVLADGAARVGRGDYVSPVEVVRHDEIGQLATAFNHMQSAIAAREEQIRHQATHDALTGLPNRALFHERLSQSIAERRAAGMIMLDIDRFKEVNDTLGHHFGDQLLIEIGRRLSHTAGPNDMVARLGGDEFAVQFTSDPGEIAARVATAFDEPIVLGDVPIDVNASVGIALYPTHAEDADTLMKRADVAMYDAKKNQIGVAMYEAGRDEHSLRRLSLMMELRQAIARDELELYFQPKADIASGRVVHAEALVRWNHPRHGVMRPDEFIPLAEQSGRIGLITKWVIRKAIAQCAAWRDEGLDLTVAVNLSALDLFDSELPTLIS